MASDFPSGLVTQTYNSTMSFGGLMSFFDPFGTVPGSSLNWSQHALLAKRDRTTVVVAGPMIDTSRICQAIDNVGQSVSDVVNTIDMLVSDLGLRLDEQEKLLTEQVDLLVEIAQTLRSPARTRAAERIRDAAELLRRHRNERALAAAEQAIDDDPNNDTAFTLAAWASLGIQDFGRARGYFREAAQATAATKGAEERHMNAVRLAARLVFDLDGPEAALRELDAADPFINPKLRAEEGRPGKEELRLACLSPLLAGAIRFDRAVYYTANNQLDAALRVFREIVTRHDVSFCLMALTDPWLSNNDAVMNVARDALNIHHALVEEIKRFLPEADARWEAFLSEIEKHDIRNAQTVAAGRRFGKLLSRGSEERREIEEKLKRFPSNRWLEELSKVPGELHNLESKIAPLIEREKMREAALEVGLQNLLRRHRKAVLVDRSRLDAVVAHVALAGGLKFQCITVDDDGVASVFKQEATNELMQAYYERTSYW